MQQQWHVEKVLGVWSFQGNSLVKKCLKSTPSLSQQINRAILGVYPAALSQLWFEGCGLKVFLGPLTLGSKIWLWLSPLQIQTETKCAQIFSTNETSALFLWHGFLVWFFLKVNESLFFWHGVCSYFYTCVTLYYYFVYNNF